MSPSSEPLAPAVLALTADLMFAARVRGAADVSGVPVQLVRTGSDLLRALSHDPRLIIIDLDARQVDPVKLIREIKAESVGAHVPILAYVSHVREDLIEAARAAGADRVMARGAFARMLPDILASTRDQTHP